MDESNRVVRELGERKPLSPEEYKKVMGVYFTRRQETVEHCGHKFQGEEEPNTGCPWCWAAFFFVNGQVSSLADEIFQKEGKEMLVKVKGRNFTKWFIRFMSEIQRRLTEINEAK